MNAASGSVRITRRAITLVLTSALISSACGDSDTDASSTSTSTTTSAAGGTSAGGASAGGASAGGSGGQGGAGGTLPVPQNQFLYVANRDSDSLSIFAIDDEGGLTAAGETAVDSPAPLAVDPTRSFLYAGSLQPETVTAYAIDHLSGALTTVGTTPLGARPVYLAINPEGGTLLLASYGDNVANSYTLQADGAVTAGAVSSHNTGTNPHSIVAHPAGAFVFVPNTNSDVISQFTFDSATNALTPNTPAALNTAAGDGPRHMVFHPNGQWLYAVNEHADSVTRFTMAVDGTLSAEETVSTLPNNVDGNSNTCADIHVTPSGQFLYASNRGHNSIAMFTINGDGTLTPNGHQPTEAVPREFEVTPDGRFVYVAGQQSGNLAAYAIEANGTLASLATYPVGQAPLWVLAISVDDPSELRD